MKLEHHFTVPAPVEDTWRTLLNPELVASCFPGVTLTSASGDEFAGTVKVRLGLISLEYQGTAKLTETDEAAHRAVIEASERDSRGSGTASVTLTLTVAGEDGVSGVTVGTDLSITGWPAQMGRVLISSVGNEVTKQFADCIADKVDTVCAVGSRTPRAASWTPSSTEHAASCQREVPDEIDLLRTAGAPVLKRLAPVLVVVAIIVWLVRR